MRRVETPIANHFSARFPRNREELELCFTLMEESRFKDKALNRGEVVSAWDRLLRDGVGDVIIIENPAYAAMLRGTGSPPFIVCLFGSFITEKFAQEIASSADISNIAAHFLTRYIAAKDGSKSPVPSVEEVIASHAKPPDKGIYFLSYMAFLHHGFTPGPALNADWNKLADCVRELTVRCYAGFNLHSWFNFIIDKYVMGGYLSNGHKVLWDHTNNSKLADADKRYILCLTRDTEVSKQLGIKPGKHELELVYADYYSDLFTASPAIAGLTDIQKKVAALLVQGYSKLEIARKLYPADWEDPDYSDAELCRRVRQLQDSICNAMKEAGYLMGRRSEGALVHLLRHNLHEVRPVIVPLYPDFHIDEKKRRAEQKRLENTPQR